MKKILALTLSIVMLAASLVVFSACGAKANVKVFEAYELTAEEYAFAIDKENTALKEAANELLADLKESGELAVDVCHIVGITGKSQRHAAACIGKGLYKIGIGIDGLILKPDPFCFRKHKNPPLSGFVSL